jgi:Domain of unknown function (DUF4124)
MPLLLSLAWLALAAPAHAAVYKCTNDKGGIVYQDTACAPGTELGSLAPPPAAKAAPAGKPAAAAAGARPGNAAERRALEVGMSEAQVIQKVGRPDVEDKGASHARWTYMPSAGDPDTLTTLTFGAGKVTNIERKPVR